jgi:hypothetical protein
MGATRAELGKLAGRFPSGAVPEVAAYAAATRTPASSSTDVAPLAEPVRPVHSVSVPTDSTIPAASPEPSASRRPGERGHALHGASAARMREPPPTSRSSASRRRRRARHRRVRTASSLPPVRAAMSAVERPSK